MDFGRTVPAAVVSRKKEARPGGRALKGQRSVAYFFVPLLKAEAVPSTFSFRMTEVEAE